MIEIGAFLAAHASWFAGSGGILAMIGGFFGGWQKWAILGGGLAVVAICFLWLRVDLANQRTTIAEQAASIATLTDQRDYSIGVANRNAAAIVEVRLAGERNVAALVAAHSRTLASVERARRLEKEIASVPADQKCTLSPGVRRLVDGLWSGAASEATH